MNDASKDLLCVALDVNKTLVDRKFIPDMLSDSPELIVSITINKSVNADVKFSTILLVPALGNAEFEKDAFIPSIKSVDNI